MLLLLVLLLFAIAIIPVKTMKMLAWLLLPDPLSLTREDVQQRDA